MNRQSANQHGCEKCRPGVSDALEQVGKEYKEYMGGKADETLTHYVCKTCGAKWVCIVESGAGGPGRFWTPE